MPPDGGYYTESPEPGNREHNVDSRRAGLFDRVRFLESRLDRMEVILLEQDRLIHAQARMLGMLNTPPMAEARRKTMVKIASEVAADNGLTLAEMQSRSKATGICYPRQYAMMLMMDAGYSSPEIGRFFGRDHATVLHGVRAARLRGEA